MSTVIYFLLFRTEFAALAARAPVADVDAPDEEASGTDLLAPPAWVSGTG